MRPYETWQTQQKSSYRAVETPAQVLHHVVLVVSNVPKALEFYSRLFDLEKKYHDTDHVAPEDYGELETGTVVFGFVHPRCLNAFISNPAAHWPEVFPEGSGRVLLSFRLQALYPTVNKALALGASVLEPPQQMPWGHWVVFLADPWGNRIELSSPERGE